MARGNFNVGCIGLGAGALGHHGDEIVEPRIKALDAREIDFRQPP